jgi:MoaA/NifB/PqqE/SkfB family radical SAM enzyme
MTIQEAIEARHSVRVYKEQPLTEEVIKVLNEKIAEVNKEGHLHIQLILNEPKAFQGTLPTEAGTEHLAFSDEHVAEMEQVLEARREEYEDIIFLSFPGDEKVLGGCLASGRGFFHIGPDGSAEPCPFSPFSDSNVAEMGVRKALQSPLFRKIRTARALGWDHTGGCTLFEHREEIEEMISPRLAVKVRCLNAQEE